MQSHTDASLYNNNYNNNTNNNVNNTDIIEVSSNENDISFEEIWELYDKKIGDIATLSQMWNKLSINDKQSVSYYIPLYKAARPNPKYRKNFFNFITCRTWERSPSIVFMSLQRIDKPVKLFLKENQLQETKQKELSKSSLMQSNEW